MPKTRQRSFIELKNVSRLCQTSTEHDKMYLIFSDNGRAVKLESLIKTLAKIHVNEDGLASPAITCRNCYAQRPRKSLCLTLNKKNETIFEVLNNQPFNTTNTTNDTTNLRMNLRLRTQNRIAKYSEHAIGIDG